ncbi:unnamed protein product [Lathyrus sativus]|nr:unnamed protein product [Lathyrus sativus]
MDTSDWRARLLPVTRPRIVSKILDTLQRHLRYSGSEGLLELQKIAQKFEEKIFVSATSQSDYLRKISLKMLTVETKSQITITNSILPSQGNFGVVPISVAVPKALSNQNNIGLNSTYMTNIPAEKEYPLTQRDHFKQKRVSLGNSSYSKRKRVFGEFFIFF